jgi:hypothetical protein
MLYVCTYQPPSTAIPTPPNCRSTRFQPLDYSKAPNDNRKDINLKARLTACGFAPIVTKAPHTSHFR